MSRDNDDPPLFIIRTVHPPPETQIITTHSAFIYRPVYDTPPPNGLLAWLLPWKTETPKPVASTLYFEAFRLEDGTVLTRRDFLKAYGCALNGLRFYTRLINSIKQWDGYYLREKYGPEVVTLMKLRQEMLTNYNELHLAMKELDCWERTPYLPHAWMAPGKFDLRNLDTAPNQLRATPKMQKSITSIVIHSARHVLALHQAGYSDKWWSIWDEQRPDPEKVHWTVFPPKYCPVPEEEITPLRKMSEGTVGDSESGSERSASSESQRSNSSRSSASDYEF